jgi:hypothetical protein
MMTTGNVSCKDEPALAVVDIDGDVKREVLDRDTLNQPPITPVDLQHPAST